MTMCGTMNPYGGCTPLVDKMIGDAYPIVKAIYDNMEYITAIGASILQSTVGQPLLLQRGVEQIGSTGGIGVTVDLPFEDLDIDHTKILTSSVSVLGSNGNKYFSDSGYFTAYVSPDGLRFSLRGDAPTAMANAQLNWFFIYGG